ncbi:MAG TPA: hypothetical protein VMS88_06930 [Terriglobales bacterium]|nr:hypothetical protein [Terriglobales bacterium]
MRRLSPRALACLPLVFACLGVRDARFDDAPPAARAPVADIGPTPPRPIREPRALEFHSEVVRIAIIGDSVEVRGLYRFLCAGSGAAFPILYPYPEDARLGGARTVSLECRAAGSSAWSAIPFTEVKAPGSIWSLPARRDTLEVLAVYRQALHARYARYIVTTTGSWGHPLTSARFEITLPAGAKPTRFSFPFRLARGSRTWVFEAADFLPDRDIEVEWR